MTTINSASEIQSSIAGLFTDMFKRKDKTPSCEPYVRPSSCPACAISLFVEIAAGRKDDNKFYQDTDFLRDYYTEVGNTTHTLLQKWLGMSGNLLGDWSCICENGKPEIVRKLSTKNTCPKCGKQAEYVEIEFDESGIKGHVDGVLRFKNGKEKVYIIIDFKGSSTLSLHQNKTAVPPKYPTKKNSKQISLYAHIFKKHYGWNVAGWALIYTARDTTKQYIVCPKYFSTKDWKDAEELFDSQVTQQKILTKTLKDLNTDRLIEHKLCKDHDYYTSNVKDQYHTCEYAAFCFSSKTKLKELVDTAAEDLLSSKTVNTTKIKRRS